MYQVFECKPILLLSKFRYDVFVKYYYVKSYIEKKNIDLAIRIYLDHIKAFNNFSEPDGEKNTPYEFIKYFNKLIDSLKANGFTTTVIPISKTGIPIDGAHRLSIALYLNCNVPFVVFDLLDGKYDRDFFVKRGMKKNIFQLLMKYIKNLWRERVKK